MCGPTRNERALASPDEVEWLSNHLPIKEIPPERYVALNANYWMAASIFRRRFPDPDVDSYVRRVEELLFDWRNLEALRREWLSPEEYEQLLREEASDEF
jgi:hypothetical protein